MYQQFTTQVALQLLLPYSLEILYLGLTFQAVQDESLLSYFNEVK
jgi:hypothetical protein